MTGGEGRGTRGTVEVEFAHSLRKAMLASGAVVLPAGIAVAWPLGGAGGLYGALAGFAVAAVHSLVVVRYLDWALTRPPAMLPTLLMISYVGRLAALALVLYGLHFVKALNMFALLGCFLALYIAHSAVEMYYAWKAFRPTAR